MNQLAEAVDQELKKQGMTRAALADKLGWSRGNVSRLLNGENKGNLESWEKTLDALGLELSVTRREDSAPRLTAAGVPFTGDEETDGLLQSQPDILERVAQLERGEAKLIPWREVKARRAAQHG